MAQVSTPKEGFRLTPRWIAGLTIMVICLIFVFSNTSEVSLRFLFFELSAPGWVFLFALLAGGFLGGWMMARSRYKG